MLLKKIRFGADDDHDMVRIILDDLRPLVPYQVALEITKALRMGAKLAARSDRTSQVFMREMAFDDFERPKAHRGFRRSKMIPNVDRWAVDVRSLGMVTLTFDDQAREFGYEDAARFQHIIRRAGRRAKAWAGDTSKTWHMLGNLTSGEEDDRLGVA